MRCFTTFKQKPNKFKPWSTSRLKVHKKVSHKYKLGVLIIFKNGNYEFIVFKHFSRAD